MSVYQIVFNGEILPGISTEQVRKNAAKLFKLTDPVKLEKLFSGAEVVLKRGLERSRAELYLKRLSEAGLRCKTRKEVVEEAPFPALPELSLMPIEPAPDAGSSSAGDVLSSKPQREPISHHRSDVIREGRPDNRTSHARTTISQPENSSGRGAASSVPEEVRGWCWGGFLLGWIWAIGNGTWIGLLGLIPFLSLPVAILLGIKGREWAWRNKFWTSVEAFNNTQKNWSIAGVVVIAIGIALYWQTFRMVEETIGNNFDENGLPNTQFIEQIEDEETRKQLEQLRQELQAELEKHARSN